MNTFKAILRLLLLIITLATASFILAVFWEYKVIRILSLALGILGLIIFIAGEKINRPRFLAFLYLSLLFGIALSVFVSMLNEAKVPFSWIFYIVYGVIVLSIFVKHFFKKKRKKDNYPKIHDEYKQLKRERTEYERNDSRNKESEKQRSKEQIESIKRAKIEEQKRKEEERKLIQGKKVIRIRGMVDILKNGKRTTSISVNKEMIIDESQRLAFTSGNLQDWVSANYPGGISRSLAVTSIKSCTIEDYKRLKC